jgi:hypothetical protein
VVLLAWHYPWAALGVVLVALVLAVLFIRTVWRALRSLGRRTFGRPGQAASH